MKKVKKKNKRIKLIFKNIKINNKNSKELSEEEINIELLFMLYIIEKNFILKVDIDIRK